MVIILKLFEHLSGHHIILVTGPHRSGTTICAKMIAEDTGHRFVVEDDIEFSKLNLVQETLEVGDPVVIQCPFLMPIIHELDLGIGLDYGETCVVVMHRYRKDIEASEEKAKRVNFKGLGYKQKLLYGVTSDLHVSDIKYDAWESQREHIPNALDVGYLSLSDHPMWVEDRKAFRFQHKVKKPPMPEGFIDGLNLIQNL